MGHRVECFGRFVVRGHAMKRRLWLVVVLSTATIVDRSLAAEIWKDRAVTTGVEHLTCNPWVDYNCEPPHISPRTLQGMERSRNCDPYLDYKCLDTYLGSDLFTRFYRYYALEWGHGLAPRLGQIPPTVRLWSPSQTRDSVRG